VPRVELGQTNKTFNIPHLSILLHIHDMSTRNTLLLLVQKIKRDIFTEGWICPPPPLCTSNSCPNSSSTPRLYHKKAAFITVIHGVIEYFKGTETMLQLQEINLAWWDPALEYPCSSPPFMPWQYTPIPCQHYTANALFCTLRKHTELHNHRNT
jgi:hypothetical protein